MEWQNWHYYALPQSYLYHTLWIKKRNSGKFVNPMGTYDGTESCELVGCHLLKNLNKYIDPSNHGLHRDVGLIIVDKCSIKSDLNIQKNLKVTDYLDITLGLRNGTISPFRKNNQPLHRRRFKPPKACF